MRLPDSFWFLFTILDDCYFKCYEDDLGGLLGELDPYLWADCKPMDPATVQDWETVCRDMGFCEENAVACVIRFLESYEEMFGFSFAKAKAELQTLKPDEVAEIWKKAHQLANGSEDGRDGAFVSEKTHSRWGH